MLSGKQNPQYRHGHTPFANFTDEELIMEVANRPKVTDLEMELALRIEQLLDELYGLQEEADGNDAGSKS